MGAFKISKYRHTGVTQQQGSNVSGYSEHSQPKKQPKGQALSPEDKARKTLIARLRIRIEHVFAGVKRSRIVKDLFRNTKQGDEDLVMEVACGLHNFRAECRHWGSP